MVRFHTRKETAAIPLDVNYRCSKCGKMTHCVSTLRVTEYDTISQANLNSGSVPLSKIAYDSLDERLCTILDEQNTERYEGAQLHCACSFCGHVEPWAKARYDKVDFLVRLISYLGLNVSLLLLIFALLFQSVGLFLATVVTLVLLCFLRSLRKSYKHWHRKHIRNAVNRLPPESLPKISFNPSKKYLLPWPKSVLTKFLPVCDPESYLKL